MKNLKEYLGKLDDFLTLYLVKKAPYTIPDNAKEIIVTYVPYLIIVFSVLIVLPLLSVFSLGAFILPTFALYTSLIFLLLTLPVLVLNFMAVPGLLKRKISGWRLMYYATLFGAFLNLIQGNLGGLIIGTGIGLYILFQVKSYYK